MITVDEFRLRFPEFSDIKRFPTKRIQLFIDDSVLEMGGVETLWGNKYNLAQHYLTAHLLHISDRTAMGDSSSNLGNIVGKSAGGVSVTRSNSNKNRSDYADSLAATSYGVSFLNIRKTCFVNFLTVC